MNSAEVIAALERPAAARVDQRVPGTHTVIVPVNQCLI
jgi:hypothetical protein